MKEEEKISAGILFCPGDPELKAIKLRTHNLNVDYNQTHEDETEKRAAILSEIIGKFGEGGFIQGPISFHYGKHTKIGKNFFGNFNLTIQDDAEVVIGDNCNFGPNVTITVSASVFTPFSSARRASSPKRICFAIDIASYEFCFFPVQLN